MLTRGKATLAGQTATVARRAGCERRRTVSGDLGGVCMGEGGRIKRSVPLTFSGPGSPGRGGELT
ncbi:MAG: hypothetical protein OXE17_07065 [Chloroflexi bacterium]|nr:hypothetical protein [Chloroflexota bacterium]